MINQSGIYQIRNKVNGKRYIGQTKGFRNRFKTHLRLLKRNVHHSQYLQNAWNKYGEDAFLFEIIEKCKLDKNILCEREQHYMDTLSPEYNICPYAGTTLGRPVTEETKDKLRQTYTCEYSELKLDSFTKIENMPNLEPWLSIKHMYNHESDIVRFASLLNGIFTSKKSKFVLSATLICDYMKIDPNIREKAVPSTDTKEDRTSLFKTLAKLTKCEHIKCILPSVGRQVGKKSRPGIYEIGMPEIVAFMNWNTEN